METGRLTLDIEDVDLARLVDDVVARLVTLASHHSLLVDAPKSLVVPVDRLRIEQVLINLLENAINFSPPGAPVRLSVADNGQVAQVAVSDEGPGVPPEERERIFERFYQSAMARAYGGLGLGLAIGRDIVESHGRTLHVEDGDGGGARFVVRLRKSGPARRDTDGCRGDA